jgi:glutamine phosphoribosylpyrophosphate amidotransferase
MGWEQAAHAAYYGMVGLQHRGQEGAGMVTGTIGHGSEKGAHSQKVTHFRDFVQQIF